MSSFDASRLFLHSTEKDIRDTRDAEVSQFFHELQHVNIHPTAKIGLPPEMRDYKMGQAHKGVFVALSARIGAGCTIDGGWGTPTRIYEDVFIMKNCHLGHDVVIGPGVEMAPHCTIGGYALISPDVKIGMGVIVLPKVVIGVGAQIGAGSVVTKDVPAGEVWVGVPARKLRDR